MRVLITGSRSWTDYETIKTAFEELGNGHTLVSGNCPQGADFLCEKAAEELGWEIELYPADWNQHGKKAGFIRNSEMVERGADVCLGFVHNNSKGASMTVRLAKKAGIETFEYQRNDLIDSGVLKKIVPLKAVVEPEEDNLLF